MAIELSKKSKQKQDQDIDKIEGDLESTLKKLDTRQGLIEIMLGNTQEEEYNPAQPNDFQNMLLRRKKMKKEIDNKIKKEQALKKQIEEQQKGHQKNDQEIDLEMSAEEVYQARLKKSQQTQPAKQESQQIGQNKGENKIKKMMEAMGWKGKGLGKQEQGIINPLTAKKTDTAAGVIVESEVPHHMQHLYSEDHPTLPNNSSRILVLENIVQTEEADDDLRQEVKEECDKFGNVKNCIIHQTAGSQSIRIFVEYEQLQDSQNAYLDFSCRFFDEKPIQADFYNEKCFEMRKFNESTLNS